MSDSFESSSTSSTTSASFCASLSGDVFIVPAETSIWVPGNIGIVIVVPFSSEIDVVGSSIVEEDKKVTLIQE